jgi:hypothetical protein
MEEPKSLICVRYKQPVVRNADRYRDVLERMHEICFHFEYEHGPEADLDIPCGPLCPMQAIENYDWAKATQEASDLNKRQRSD